MYNPIVERFVHEEFGTPMMLLKFLELNNMLFFACAMLFVARAHDIPKRLRWKWNIRRERQTKTSCTFLYLFTYFFFLVYTLVLFYY